MTASSPLRLGTRGSLLALTQSNWVAQQLRDAHPGLQVDLVQIKTRGDKILDVALSKVGGKGLFVKEIETALLAGEVDLAVHSMKDLPTELPAGLGVVAVPKRVDPRDAVILPDANGTAEAEPLPLPPGAVVGTSSLRRQAQLLHLRPDVSVCEVRGNVDTRLRKLAEGQFDALLLAAAGLERLGRSDCVSRFLEPDQWLPAVGQGALAIEARLDDDRTRSLLAALNEADTALCTRAERALLATLEGGCQVPLGGHCRLEGQQLRLAAFVGSPDGAQLIRETATGDPAEPEALGQAVAETLREAGADALLAALREEEA